MSVGGVFHQRVQLAISDEQGAYLAFGVYLLIVVVTDNDNANQISLHFQAPLVGVRGSFTSKPPSANRLTFLRSSRSSLLASFNAASASSKRFFFRFTLSFSS